MPAPPVIAHLVERFDQQSDTYKSGHYNEAQLRQEFIDPMFKALEWDMDNVSCYAEAYKDVIHEDAIKIGGSTKAPDYCFRIGGTRKFFLEAKKPSVDIKSDAQPAYQLRRYAWSAKLPLSVLTDFEEFAVYDRRVEPKLIDKASVATGIDDLYFVTKLCAYMLSFSILFKKCAGTACQLKFRELVVSDLPRSDSVYELFYRRRTKSRSSKARRREKPS